MEPNPMQNNPVPPMPPTPPVEPPRRRRTSLVGPVILVLLGLAFLAQNLGIFQFNVWEAMWRLWPVWLIAAGLDMLVGRRSSWGSWVALGLVVTIVGGSVWYFSNWASAGPGEVQRISESLHDAKRATIDIKAGVGEVRVGASSHNEMLVEGNIYRLPGERISSSATGSNGDVTYVLKSEGINFGPGVNVRAGDATWDLQLNNQVPIDLRLGTGVGKSVVDLERLNLTNLEVNFGVGESNIVLPAQGQFNVRVKSGIGKSVIEIPAGMEARIRATAGIGNIDVNGDFQRDGSYYLSRNFDSAQNRVEIDVNGGIGELRIIKR